MQRNEELIRVPKIKLIPGERRREYVITEGVLSKLLAHEKCTPLLRNLLPFLIDTGLRILEALSLLWEDMNLDAVASVFVKKGKTKFARRTIPLTKRSKEILVKMEERGEKGARSKDIDQLFVFPSSEGKRLSRHWPSSVR